MAVYCALASGSSERCSVRVTGELTAGAQARGGAEPTEKARAGLAGRGQERGLARKSWQARQTGWRLVCDLLEAGRRVARG